jgi:23S rRNA pseudouridine2605 synthase
LPQLAQGKWNMVGRLDLNTSGLLLFSDSGTLAHRLMHPSANIEREYIVRIRGQVQAKDIQQLLQGISLEDGFAQFKAIHLLGEKQHNPSFKVILMEGRNREVRRLWEALGYQITRLCRIRYGHIILPPSLKPKQYMVIAKSQVKRWLEEIDQPS